MQAVSVTILLVAALSTSALADETTPIRRADMRDLKASATYVGGDVQLKLSNVMDGVAYSSWAGGTQGKEGVWISVHFAGTRYISQVELLPGCAGSNRVYGLFGRPRSLELVSGGRTVTLQVKDKRRTQVFQIDPPLAATRLKINAGNHYPGRLPAVCLTELQLHEQTALGSLDSATRQRLEIHASALGAEDASAAIVGLVAMGPAAVPRLAVALREADPLTQERALTALHRIGAPSAAMPLMRYWQAGPPTDLRKLTIKALARTGHDAVIPLIAEIMKGDDYELANQAAATVGSFGKAMLPALEPLLKSPFADVVERTVRAMRHIGDLRVVALAKPFCRAHRSDHRAAAAEALASSPCEASTVELRKLADDKHPHVRFAVAKSLDVYPDADSTLILTRLLRDTDPYVANKALDVLANKTQGLRHLAAYISSDHAPLGKEAIMMLAQTGSPKATEIMMDALRRGDSRFRQSLQDGILAMGEEAIATLVEGAASDENLRHDAERILARTPEIAVPIIAALVEEEPGATPHFLLRALGKSGAGAALDVLDKVWDASPPSTRIQVIRAWGDFKADEVRERLLKAINEGDTLSRIEAVRAAARAGVTEIGPVLARALSDGSLPAEIAIEGLGQLENTSGMDYMVKEFPFADMGVRLAILHACNRIQGRQCMNLLYDAARDHNPHIRTEVIRLLEAQ